MTEITKERADNLLKMLLFLAAAKNHQVTKNLEKDQAKQGEVYTLFYRGKLIAQLKSKHGAFYYQEKL